MTARTHDLFAFTSLTAAAIYFPLQPINVGTIFVAIIACDIGSLIPDMDQSTNRLWDLAPGGNVVGKFARRLFLGHRSLSHSILGAFLLYKLLLWLTPMLFNQLYINSQVVTYALMIGFISHLFADSLTEEGIPLFFPLRAKFGLPPIARWRIKTGKWFETFVVFPAVLVLLFYLVSQNQNKLIDLLAAPKTGGL